MRSTLLALIFVLASCKDDSPVECSQDDDCLQGGVHGTCEPSPESDHNWCAFPDNSCDSHSRWGILAGDGLASECVGDSPDAGAPDAAEDAGPRPDGMVPEISTKIILTAQNQDTVFVYAADTLQAEDSAPLPDRAGSGSSRVAVADGSVWVSSLSDVTALAGDSLLVEDGFPKPFDATMCTPANAVYFPLGMYCLHDQAGVDADGLNFFEGHALTFSKGVLLPSPVAVGGSPTRILASYGGDGLSVAVLDATGTPVVGSPFTAEVNGRVFHLAVSDELNRIAVGAGGGGTQVQIFDRATFVSAGVITLNDSVASIVFDDVNGHLIVSQANGDVGAYESSTLATAIPVASRAAGTLSRLVYDGSRNRIYGIASSPAAGFNKFLVVLDATTLEHVAGSPVVLPASATSVTFF